MNQPEANANTTNVSSEQLYRTHFHLRCPECLKLYSVAWAEVSTDKPHFVCSSCQTYFCADTMRAMSLPPGEIIVGERVDMSPVAASFDTHEKTVQFDITNNAVFNCPKCDAPYAAQDKECSRCGVIFSKLAEFSLRRTGPAEAAHISATPELKSLWEDVLLDYENSNHHQKFIQACLVDDNLEYAAAKYRGILDVVPQDDIAKKSLEKIKSLTALRFEVAESSFAENVEEGFDWRRLPQSIWSAARHVRVSSLIMFLSGVLIVIGLLVPHLRNLIGLGAAILSFVLALRYYFRN